MFRLFSCAPILLLLCALLPLQPLRSGEVGFIEDFALAEDRGAVLERLVPGSDDHFFYRILLAQHDGDLARAQELLEEWEAVRRRHNRGRSQSEVRMLTLRQMVLQAATGSPEHIQRLARRDELQIHHRHQREGTAQEAVYPTRLDPQAVSWEAFRATTFKFGYRIGDFNDPGLRRLLDEGYNFRGSELDHLLDSLDLSDHPALLPLIIADLQRPQSAGFGSRKVHAGLDWEQLQALAEAWPAALNSQAWVSACIARLAPPAHLDLERDAEARLAWLERLQELAQRLPPVHDLFAAQVLHQRLMHDLRAGVVDEDRLLAYLSIPRRSSYAHRRWLDRREVRERLINPGQSFPDSGLPAIGDDSEFVHDLLRRALAGEASPERFADIIEQDYLQRVFVEAQVLAGIGQAQDWLSRVNDPAWAQALQQRVDLAFAPDHRRHFRSDELVRLAIETKHIDHLLVNIYELDAGNALRASDGEIDLSIDLDGLVANHQLRFSYSDHPLQRLRRELELPQISGRGLAIVEMIGNGQRLRALVRRGELQLVERVGAAGHVFTVLDEDRQPLSGARMWLGARSFAARENGTILIPFADKANSASVIVEHGNLAERARFSHLAEDYHLELGLHVEREALVAGREATLLLRPRLTMHGQAVDFSLVEEPRLTVTATDSQGIATTRVVEGIELGYEQELRHSFRVSEELRTLRIELSGRLRRLADGEYVELSAASLRRLADHEDSTHTDAAHLQRTAAGWVLQLLGRSGEARPGQHLVLHFTHAHTSRRVAVTLRSDERGRIELGELPDITRLRVHRSGDQASWQTEWALDDDQPELPRRLHLAAGDSLRIPWSRGPESLSRADLSLIARRGDQSLADHFAALSWEDGFLVAPELPSGSYRFYSRRNGVAMDIEIGGHPLADGWIAHGQHLRQASGALLQISDVERQDDTLRARVHGAGPETRVHVIASFWEPRWQAGHGLALAQQQPSLQQLDPRPSLFSRSVALGDEERYILERRDATPRPGVMLSRPSLLIHPWQLPEDSSVSSQPTTGSGAFQSRSGSGRSRGLGLYGGSSDSGPSGLDPSLAFLPQAPLLLANLRPDAEGMLNLQHPALATMVQVRLVAVEGSQLAQRRVALPEQPLEPRDLRVQHPAGAELRIQRQHISTLRSGEQLRLEAALGTEVELIDSLGKLFAHLSSLSSDPRLARFAFLSSWDQLDEAAKLERYFEHACHELRLFLYRRDRPFFDAVVAPLLAHKLTPTFLDHYFLHNELDRYLEPWRWERLNYFERALLAGRLPAAAGDGIRLALDQALVLLPADSARQNRIIATALRGRALDQADASGLRQAVSARDPLPRPAPPREPAVEGFVVEQLDTEAEELAAESLVPLRRVAARSRSEDVAARQTLRGLYRGPGSTRIYAEHNYYQRRQAEQDGSLLPLRRLWRDLAQHDADQPFLSPGLLEADGSLHEALLALALADLPFSPPEHQIQRDDQALVITAAAPLLAVYREIDGLEEIPEAAPLLVAQNAFRIGERHRLVDGEEVDHFLRDEFVIHTPYACEVVVSNPSSTRRRIDILTLLPAGSMPLAGSRASQGRPLVLEPYASERVELSFYFPSPGTFSMPAASVAHNGQPLAMAEALSFAVVAEPSLEDRDSWAWISQHATSEAVLSWLRSANLQQVELSRMAWRMRDQEFYHSALAILDQRRAFDHVLWGYAFLHQDLSRMGQLLAQRPSFLRATGPLLVSDLVHSQPQERVWYEHLEFAPLINVRAHRLGRRPWIANQQQANHYDALLQRLAFTPHLSDADRLEAAYHLLLQDRIDEAIRWFAGIDREALRSQMPYDYAAAWLAFAQADLEAAVAIAETYVDRPLGHWQERFAAVIAQVQEVHSGQVSVIDPRDRDQQHTALAASEPELGLRLDQGQLLLTWQGMDTVELRYHLLDVELRFSRAPFAQDGRSLPLTAPNHRQDLALPDGQDSLRLELPADIAQRNVLVEVVGSGRRASLPVLSSSMTVQPVAAYGQLRVSAEADRRPLDTVYVKVYRRMKNGDIEFHKDGYTDLRGRFDYASINDLDYRSIDALAVLVLSADHGAVILELAPPAQ